MRRLDDAMWAATASTPALAAGELRAASRILLDHGRDRSSAVVGHGPTDVNDAGASTPSPSGLAGAIERLVELLATD
jgi:hypothetical protein